MKEYAFSLFLALLNPVTIPATSAQVVTGTVHQILPRAKVSSESTHAIRPAWEWTDDERLAVRFDPAAIRERTSREATEPYGAWTPAATTQQSGRSQAQATGTFRNVIVGRRNPELFMPFELFTFLIEGGFNEDARQRENFRKSHASVVARTGLQPEKFWELVELASTDYIANMRHEQALAHKLNRANTDDERMALRQQIKNNQQPQCAQRAAALAAAARRVGGTAFYRVLYEGIAPMITVGSTEPDLAASYRYAAGGCQGQGLGADLRFSPSHRLTLILWPAIILEVMQEQR